MRPVSVKRLEGPRTASSTTAATMWTEDLVVALFLVCPGKGGGGEGLPCRFSFQRRHRRRQWIVCCPCRGRRWGAFAPPGGVADHFDRVFQMGRLDNAQSCLSPGGRAYCGKVGDGGAGDKNDSMASAPMVTAALGGRATWTWRAGPWRQRRLTWW